MARPDTFPEMESATWERRASVLSVCLFVALMAAPWFGHSDIGDGQVYSVVARHLVEDGVWTQTRYLPTVHPSFHEHLPFGFWVMAVTIRVLGEAALEPLFGLFSTLCLVASGFGARKLFGPWAGVATMVVLGTTPHFFAWAGHPLLDPLLLMLSTWAGVLVLSGRFTPSVWLGATLLTTLAVLVKGPFGLLPLGGAVAARVVMDRSIRYAVWGALAMVLSVTPAMLFLRTHPDWWSGYFEQQLLASASGARADGVLSWYFPLEKLAARYWPGLLLTPFSAAVALGFPRQWGDLDLVPYRRASRTLFVASAAVIFALCLPARKLWHHTLVAYPYLSMWAAIGVAMLLRRFAGTSRAQRRVVGALALLVVVAFSASALGLRRHIINAPCTVERFFDAYRPLFRGQQVLIVSHRADWDLMSALVKEERAISWPVTAVTDGPEEARIAFVAEDLWPIDGWSLVSRGGGYVLARR